MKNVDVVTIKREQLEAMARTIAVAGNLAKTLKDVMPKYDMGVSLLSDLQVKLAQLEEGLTAVNDVIKEDSGVDLAI